MKNFQSGNTINQGTFKSFFPATINRIWTIDNMELIKLLGQADRQLGRLDMYSEYVPNVELFITMHIAKEATKSNMIEGTKTNIEDVVLNKEDIDIEKRSDWEEVQNYISALNLSIENLETLPFSTRLIKEAHRTLLKGVRGRHKQPGEFRVSQNWVGGASIDDAVFIPPPAHTINNYMSDLESFIHNNSYFPDLLKIALTHYQFETIHPFLDGNGRVGRLMITLLLVEKGILKNPILYLSDFFEKNRNLYYENLTKVREDSDLLQWFKFFLVGVIETAKNGVTTFDGILKLKGEMENQIQSLGSRAPNAQIVLNHLFQQPYIDAPTTKKITSLSLPSVHKLLNNMENLGVIDEVTGGKRSKVYIFNKYINLFK